MPVQQEVERWTPQRRLPARYQAAEEPLGQSAAAMVGQAVRRKPADCCAEERGVVVAGPQMVLV